MPRAKRTETLTFRITKAEKKRLVALAKKEDLSMTEFIVRLINKYHDGLLFGKYHGE